MTDDLSRKLDVLLVLDGDIGTWGKSICTMLLLLLVLRCVACAVTCAMVLGGVRVFWSASCGGSD